MHFSLDQKMCIVLSSHGRYRPCLAHLNVTYTAWLVLESLSAKSSRLFQIHWPQYDTLVSIGLTICSSVILEGLSIETSRIMGLCISFCVSAFFTGSKRLVY